MGTQYEEQAAVAAAIAAVSVLRSTHSVVEMPTEEQPPHSHCYEQDRVPSDNQKFFIRLRRFRTFHVNVVPVRSTQRANSLLRA